MATETISAVGEEIDSKCTKCKDVTNHTIVAMVEEKIAKVECKVCGGRHIYRPAKPAKAAKKKAPAKKKATKAKMTIAAKKAADTFAKLMKGRNEKDALAYSMTSTFTKNDMINHPKFGLGVVSATIPPNKIELTFNEGPRVFICKLEIAVPEQPAKGKKK